VVMLRIPSRLKIDLYARTCIVTDAGHLQALFLPAAGISSGHVYELPATMLEQRPVCL
jgi:hypothetical protein